MGTPMDPWCDVKRPNLAIEDDGKRIRCERGRLLSSMVIHHPDGDVTIKTPSHKTKPRAFRRPKGDRKGRLARRGQSRAVQGWRRGRPGWVDLMVQGEWSSATTSTTRSWSGNKLSAADIAWALESVGFDCPVKDVTQEERDAFLRLTTLLYSLIELNPIRGSGIKGMSKCDLCRGNHLTESCPGQEEDDESDKSRSVSKTLGRLRKAGWSVAVHNDYNLNGKKHTFWLFTHPSGVWIKGEGRSDRRALAEAEKQTETRRSAEQERRDIIAWLKNVADSLLAKDAASGIEAGTHIPVTKKAKSSQ